MIDERQAREDAANRRLYAWAAQEPERTRIRKEQEAESIAELRRLNNWQWRLDRWCKRHAAEIGADFKRPEPPLVLIKWPAKIAAMLIACAFVVAHAVLVAAAILVGGWPRELLQAGRVPESWTPPEHMLELRTKVRLRHTLVNERGTWQRRIQAQLYHHGVEGRRQLLVSERAPGSRATSSPTLARR
jgi:hypothetical protein